MSSGNPEIKVKTYSVLAALFLIYKYVLIHFEILVLFKEKTYKKLMPLFQKNKNSLANLQQNQQRLRSRPSARSKTP